MSKLPRPEHMTQDWIDRNRKRLTKDRSIKIQTHVTQETLLNIYDNYSKLPQTYIDTYNRYTDDINAARNENTRNLLLDNRHEFYCQIMLDLKTNKG